MRFFRRDTIRGTLSFPACSFFFIGSLCLKSVRPPLRPSSFHGDPELVGSAGPAKHPGSLVNEGEWVAHGDTQGPQGDSL